MNPADIDAINKTQEWIESFVIGLNLCPFAKKPFEADQIRFRVSRTDSNEKILEECWNEIEVLENNSSDKISNTFLILPFATEDFRQFFDVAELAVQLLKEQKKKRDYQLVVFHPRFRFEGAELGEVGNQVNQSPFPMIHILREKEVSEAVNSHVDIAQIPVRNQIILEERGKNLT